MINGRLAKHYGIAGVEGWEFQRKPVPPGSHRGGLLTMAGVLKVTANGTTTSPVLRGAWVMDRILGHAAPAAARQRPRDRPRHPRREDDPRATGQAPRERVVRGLPSQDRSPRVRPGKLRLHRRLARELPLDRPGRERLHRRPAHALSQGEKGRPRRRHRRRRAVREHRRVQANPPERPTRLARALATKLIAYATGRAPQEADSAAVDAIVTRIGAKDDGLRTLVHEIVQSELFQNK